MSVRDWMTIETLKVGFWYVKSDFFSLKINIPLIRLFFVKFSLMTNCLCSGLTRGRVLVFASAHLKWDINSFMRVKNGIK